MIFDRTFSLYHQARDDGLGDSSHQFSNSWISASVTISAIGSLGDGSKPTACSTRLVGRSPGSGFLDPMQKPGTHQSLSRSE
jgi:hypothetical protein